MIFQHGITGNRTQALAIADAAAAAGFAVISIDIPLHGLTDTTNPLYAGPIERTFNVDLIDNATSAPGPDGNIDGSGAHFINLQSLVTSRDNLRQASADLMTLAATIPGMDMNGDSLPDFDGARIHYTGLSLGSIIGTVFTANEPTVNVATLVRSWWWYSTVCWKHPTHSVL